MRPLKKWLKKLRGRRSPVSKAPSPPSSFHETEIEHAVMFLEKILAHDVPPSCDDFRQLKEEARTLQQELVSRIEVSSGLSLGPLGSLSSVNDTTARPSEGFQRYVGQLMGRFSDTDSTRGVRKASATFPASGSVDNLRSFGKGVPRLISRSCHGDTRRGRRASGPAKAARVGSESITSSLPGLHRASIGEPLVSASAGSSDSKTSTSPFLEAVHSSEPSTLSLAPAGASAVSVFSDRVQSTLSGYLSGLSTVSSLMKLNDMCHGWPLTTVCYHILRRHSVLQVLGLESVRVIDYLQAIELGYPEKNAYHNRVHGADVVARMYTLVRAIIGLADKGRPSIRQAEVLLASVLAAAVHDYLHPGTSNMFQYKAMSGAARRYNYKSVLENVSISHALELARKHGLFDALLGCQSRRIRTLMVDLVLATDVANHFDILKTFETSVVTQFDVVPALFRSQSAPWKGQPAADTALVSRLASVTRPTDSVTSVAGGAPSLTEVTGKRSVGPEFFSLPENQRCLILQVAIKLADFGHFFLPWQQHQDWCHRLEDEFFSQGDEERRRGMSVSPLMDRSLPGVFHGPNQVSFMETFVLPLAHRMADVFPKCAELLEQAEANMAKWHSAAESSSSTA